MVVKFKDLHHESTEENMINTTIKVIVFDLDGTLYEDTHHFDYYAKKLQSKLPIERQIPFWEDYQSALKGEHAIKIGRVYDVEQGWILVQERNVVKEAYSWNGNQQSATDILESYSDPIMIDQINMISIGDLWWLPAAIARHYRLSVKDANDAFLETRSYMMSSEFVMEPVRGFKEALEKLKKKGFELALLTNSPQKDSEIILIKLGLENSFDHKLFEGQKPTYTAKRFHEIKEHFQVQYSNMMSIGDNWINEILPAKDLGCSTILIDPHHISKKSYADHIVRNISELTALLRGF